MNTYRVPGSGLRLLRRGVVVPLLTAILLLASAAAARATTYTVNTTSDPSGQSDCTSTCSLRQAISDAQNGDTIDIPAGAYGVTQGTIEFSNSITITGAGITTTTIDGTGNSDQNSSGRIFKVDSGTVTIQDLTLTNGDDANDEKLQSCNPCYTIDLNGGGALFNAGGDVSLNSVAITNDLALLGGGVSNDATLTMTDVSFANDSGGGVIGGGLFTRTGTVSGTGVTFEDDATGADDESAAYLLGGTVSFTNSTIVDSGGAASIGGGIHNGGATLTLNFDTLAGNSRGSIETDQGASTTVGDTIIGAGNSDGGNGDCVAPGEPDDANDGTSGAAISTDNGYNLDQDGSCDLMGTGDISSQDPRLAPATDNGGAVPTEALLTGSPAIDAGDDADCPSTDARGISRPQGSHCDVGAFEVEVAPANTAAPAISGTPNIGQTLTCSQGTWTGSGDTYAYQWNRDASALLGQTSSTYIVQPADADHSLTCTVTATNGGGSASKTSGAIAVPANSHTASTSPVIAQPTRSGGVVNAKLVGSVNPEGSATKAYFIYGLDGRYQPSGTTQYDMTTPPQQLGSGSSSQTLSAPAPNLVPDAVYHVRLVAINAGGTTTGPDSTFKTPALPAPPQPVLGRKENLRPVSGRTFELEHGKLVPLTENTQLSAGTVIDALNGSIGLAAATGTKGHEYTGTFGGAVFRIEQTRGGANKGLTTLSIVEGAFKGAPSYAACTTKPDTDRAAGAHAALSSRVLQTLRSRVSGRFSTRGRYAAGTVRGTQWTTSDRCNGTLIAVQVHAVFVTDLVKHITVLVHAGHHYLALAPKHG